MRHSLAALLLCGGMAQASEIPCMLDAIFDTPQLRAERSFSKAWQEVIKDHPSVKSGKLPEVIEGYAKSGQTSKFLAPHLSDWFKSLGLNDPKLAESYRSLWPMLDLRQKQDTVAKLLRTIEHSPNAQGFFAPGSKPGAEMKRAIEAGFTPAEAVEFGQRWRSLSPDERMLFLLASMEDEMPGILNAASDLPADKIPALPAAVSTPAERAVTKVHAKSLTHHADPDTTRELVPTSPQKRPSSASYGEPDSTHEFVTMPSAKKRALPWAALPPPESLIVNRNLTALVRSIPPRIPARSTQNYFSSPSNGLSNGPLKTSGTSSTAWIRYAKL